jgi:hypothetical protein
MCITSSDVCSVAYSTSERTKFTEEIVSLQVHFILNSTFMEAQNIVLLTALAPWTPGSTFSSRIMRESASLCSVRDLRFTTKTSITLRRLNETRNTQQTSNECKVPMPRDLTKTRILVKARQGVIRSPDGTNRESTSSL